MPAFKLYGARGSTNTDRVRLTLAEGGFTDYELVILNLQKGEQKVSGRLSANHSISLKQRICHIVSRVSQELTWSLQSDENLKRHPWGKVPVLVNPDGFTIYESRAIAQYVARKYKFPLLPPSSDLEATAMFDQALSVETGYFADAAGRVGFELFAKKFMGLPPDETVVAAAVKAIESFLDVAEGLLSSREYMAGDDFSLIDIFYIPTVQRLFACGQGDLILKRKAVSVWWDRVVSRPAIKKVLDADKAAFAAMVQK